MINRKQFLEYKLKLSSRLTTDNSGANNNNSTISASERAALITELTEIHNNLEVLMNQYERRFGESYSKMTTTNTSVGGGGGGGSTTTTSMASASMLNTSGSNVDSSRGIIATAVVGDGMTMNTPIKISSLSSPPGQQQLQLRHIPSNPSASSLPPQQQQQQQSSSSIRSGGIPLNSVNSSSSPNVRVMHHTR